MNSKNKRKRCPEFLIAFNLSGIQIVTCVYTSCLYHFLSCVRMHHRQRKGSVVHHARAVVAADDGDLPASYLVVEPPPPPADDLSDVLVVVRLFPAHGGEQAEHVLALPEQDVPDQRLLPPLRMGVRSRSRSRSRSWCRRRTLTKVYNFGEISPKFLKYRFFR